MGPVNQMTMSLLQFDLSLLYIYNTYGESHDMAAALIYCVVFVPEPVQAPNRFTMLM